jgi:hypothetical protein
MSVDISYRIDVEQGSVLGFDSQLMNDLPSQREVKISEGQLRFCGNSAEPGNEQAVFLTEAKNNGVDAFGFPKLKSKSSRAI